MIKRRQNWTDSQRVDLSHIRSIESAGSNDFDDLVNSVFTNSVSQILRGFTIGASGITGPANSLQMIVANAAILHSASNTSGTVLKVSSSASPEILNPITNSKVSGSFVAGTDNYVGLEIIRAIDDSTTDTVYTWDPTTNTEIAKSIPLALVLDYQIVISTTPWASNVLPVALVITDGANNAISITDQRPLMYRLGSAGFNTPNPSYVYPWTDGRSENPSTSIVNSSSPFVGGDKQLASFKDWADAIMSVIKEVKGTTYWYSTGASFGSLVKLAEDATKSVVTGSGVIKHDATTPGLMNWSQDFYVKVIGSELKYRIDANAIPSTFITLADEEVAYLDLQRDEPIIPNLVWTNGSPTVTSVGAVSWTSSLLAADLIKVGTGDDSEYYEILTVDSASQVTLTSNFSGVSTGAGGVQSVYSFGSYQAVAVPSTPRDIQIAAKTAVPLDQNSWWVFYRADDGGAAKVYVRLNAVQLGLGESTNISNNIPAEILTFIGATSDSDSAPSYSTQVLTPTTTGNSFVADAQSLTAGIHQLDVEANNPLRPKANFTPDQTLLFEDSSVQSGDGANKTVGPVSGSVYFNLSGATLDFSAAQPVGTNPSDFDIDAITPTNGNFYVAAFSLQADGKIKVSLSAGDAVLVNLQDPVVVGTLFPKTNSPIGYVYLQYVDGTSFWKSATSVSNVIENADIYRFGSGAGSVGGEEGSFNDDLISLYFRGKVTDSFDESLSSPLTTISNSGLLNTTATYSAGFQLYQISYDASQTVTGTGTAMTISAPPAFTVVAGDILNVGLEARRINTVTTQTSYVLESAFTVDPSASACCISQAVVTKDIYGFAGDGISQYDAFSGATFTEFMVDFEDSSTVNDNIFDIAQPPVIQWSASGDATVWTDVGTRQTLQITAAQSAFLAGASDEFYLRLFAKKSSGSGTVNLLNYRAYLQKDPGVTTGVQNSSIAMTDLSSQTNCIISVSGGKTRIVLPYSYPVNVSPGLPYGSLDVYLNGQLLPRFISVAATPSSYYTEVNGTTIDLDSDYSATPLEVEVLQRISVVDTNTQNTTDIAILQSQATPKNLIVNGAFDINQVVPGVASSINTATPSHIRHVDMWSFVTAGSTVKNITSLQSTTVPTTAQSGFASTYSLVTTINTGIGSFAASDIIRPFRYAVEGYDFESIHQQTFTLSFWAYASIAGTYNVSFKNSASNRSYVTTFSISSPATWEFKTITIAADQSGTWLLDNGIGLDISIGSYTGATFATASTNTWQSGEFYAATGSTNWMATSTNALYIAQVSLVKGQYGYAANEFYRNGVNVRDELASCQRYYEKSYNINVIAGTITPNGKFSSHETGAGQVWGSQNYRVSKCFTPTVAFYSPSTGTVGVAQANNGGSADFAVTTNGNGLNGFDVATTNVPNSDRQFGWHFVADARL